jgi:hypothetical protein
MAKKGNDVTVIQKDVIVAIEREEVQEQMQFDKFDALDMLENADEDNFEKQVSNYLKIEDLIKGKKVGAMVVSYELKEMQGFNEEDGVSIKPIVEMLIKGNAEKREVVRVAYAGAKFVSILEKFKDRISEEKPLPIRFTYLGKVGKTGGQYADFLIEIL